MAAERPPGRIAWRHPIWIIAVEGEFRTRFPAISWHFGERTVAGPFHGHKSGRCWDIRKCGGWAFRPGKDLRLEEVPLHARHCMPASVGGSCPDRPNQLQPTSHRPSGTAELRGDLVDRAPLEFPEGDPPQVLVAQDLEEATILLPAAETPAACNMSTI